MCFPIFDSYRHVRGRPCKYADTTPQQLRKELKREGTQGAKVWRDRSPQRHQMMHLMKLLVALALAAAPSARGMAPYVPSTDEPTAMPSTSPTKDPTPAPTVEKDGCGEPCADVITVSSSFPTIESGTCYVVDGTFPIILEVPYGVNCAKIRKHAPREPAAATVLLLLPIRDISHYAPPLTIKTTIKTSPRQQKPTGPPRRRPRASTTRRRPTKRHP